MAVSFHQLLPALLLLANLFSFAWGMRAFFIHPSGYTTGMKAISACGVIFGIVHLGAILFSPGVAAVQSQIAVLIYLGSLGLYWWAILANRKIPLSAAFSEDAPKHLNESGPYRFIRHPFYCSYLLTWSAGIFASGQLWIIATVIVMMVIYFRAAILEERKFSQSSLASAYAAYRRRTGLLMPNPVKLLAGRRSP